jgi:hypothetical protein
MGSFPSFLESSTQDTLRQDSPVLATRSKQENCPFHFGFMSAAILVSPECAITSKKLLEHAKTAGYQRTSRLSP